MTATVEERIKKAEFVPRMLWAALTASIPIYGIVAFVVLQDGPLKDKPLVISDSVGIAVVVLAAVLSLVFRKKMLTESRLKRFVARPPLPNIATLAEGLNARQKVQLRVPQWALSSLLVSWAINESVAVFGLVYSLLAGSLEKSWVFFAVAFVLNLLAYPRFEEYYSMAKRVVD